MFEIPPLNQSFHESHESNDLSKRWMRWVKAYLRREKMEKNGTGQDKLSRIKSELRQETQEAQQAFEQLLREEFVVDPETIQVAAELLELTKRKFPKAQNLGIILMGSGVHGGMTLRKALQTLRGESMHKEGDIDWGLLQSGKGIRLAETPQLIKEVNSYLSQRPGTIKKSCDDYNPVFFTVNNLESVQDALNALESIINTEDGSYDDVAITNILLYFQPSYPPRCNEVNRSYMLLALQQVSQHNPQLWRDHIDSLMYSWMQIHNVKEKHLLSSTLTGRLTTYAENIAKYSGSALNEPFRKLLEGTFQEP